MQNAHPACYHALAQKTTCSTTHPFAESHQNFRGELRLSSALGQKAQQRHHLLLGTHQAVGDDVGTPVLRGRDIQQQRVPEGFSSQHSSARTTAQKLQNITLTEMESENKDPKIGIH